MLINIIYARNDYCDTRTFIYLSLLYENIVIIAFTRTIGINQTGQ